MEQAISLPDVVTEVLEPLEAQDVPTEAAKTSTEPEESLKLFVGRPLDGHPPLLPGKVVTVRCARDAKRLFTKLINEFQRGRILSREAKDLCYLLTGFMTACVNADLEERLERLEKK